MTRKGLDDFRGDRGRVLLLGQSGSGKTTLAGSVAELGKTLYCYTIGEEGIGSLRGEEWSDNIDVERITDPTQIRDIYHELLVEGHGYEALVLDSWSAMDRMWRKYLLRLEQNDIRPPEDIDSFMEIQDWGKIADITMDVMTSLYGLASADNPSPVHVIITSQVTEFEDEDANEKGQRVGAAVSKGCRTHVHSVPDYILHLEIAEDPDSFDGPAMHRVRLLPDERVVTKLHTTRAHREKLPVTVGNAQQRLTMKKLFRLVGVPTGEEAG